MLQSFKKKKNIYIKQSEATKIAVNQEEQSADRTLRGNKRGADYLQSLLSGKLMLNQFDKMHLFRQAGASRGNVWSLAKMCFVGFFPSAFRVCYPICSTPGKRTEKFNHEKKQQNS